MGRIARVLSFFRTERNGAKLSDVKLDPGGGPNVTGEHFADPGDDSYPLTTDYAVTIGTQRGGSQIPVGYADPINTPKAGKGDKRIYGRDPSSGVAVNEVWLKADGAILVSNADGSFELKADGSMKGLNASGSFELESAGDFVVNGAKITASGEIINAAGKVLGTHTHAQGNDSNGATEVETNVPT